MNSCNHSLVVYRCWPIRTDFSRMPPRTPRLHQRQMVPTAILLPGILPGINFAASVKVRYSSMWQTLIEGLP